MQSHNIKINAKRLWSDLESLGRIGLNSDGGVTRIALSPADQEAREWLIEKIEAAGLQVAVDAAMNVIGTLPAKHPSTKKKAASGSHLDTVPLGGRFDGALGVVCALECARTISEYGIELPWDFEVISFCDEEGGHYAGTVGSRAMLGQLKDREIFNSRTAEHNSFAQSLERLGKDPERICDARRNPEDFAFFIEVHIEQGRVLESKGMKIGVVTAIVGIDRSTVTVKGEAAHAGTTPMKMRKDALVEAAPVFTLLPEWLAEQNSEMVGTIGQVFIAPGADNVVPETCSFSVELRSQNPEDMNAVRTRIENYAGCREGWKVKSVYKKAPTPLDDLLIETITQASRAEKLSCTYLPSGAGHDAQSFASCVQTGMIFIPCRQGISHNPAESISFEDAANGCQVLLETILKLADDEKKLEK